MTPPDRRTGPADRRGVKYDGSKVRMDLLPPNALVEIAKVLTYGAAKYSAENWRKVPGWRWRYFGATLRHLWAYHGGERIDPESGCLHLAHAACCVLFLLELETVAEWVPDPWAGSEPPVGRLDTGEEPATRIWTVMGLPQPGATTPTEPPRAPFVDGPTIERAERHQAAREHLRKCEVCSSATYRVDLDPAGVWVITNLDAPSLCHVGASALRAVWESEDRWLPSWTWRPAPEEPAAVAGDIRQGPLSGGSASEGS